ncbi:hypothetical protein G6O69_15700 [Pseudenhygromyxa sp. WMMC2535]|nr:hypothetical protein [Pseudenhygromyxa sp. WMMC2535]NVB39288.1 hypothetical protein [Pseudenhygromyxa sp. WMMC2535]
MAESELERSGNHAHAYVFEALQGLTVCEQGQAAGPGLVCATLVAEG